MWITGDVLGTERRVALAWTYRQSLPKDPLSDPYVERAGATPRPAVLLNYANAPPCMYSVRKADRN